MSCAESMKEASVDEMTDESMTTSHSPTPKPSPHKSFQMLYTANTGILVHNCALHHFWVLDSNAGPFTLPEHMYSG